jgi:4-methoxybenzoate monooxygenase (O-demethylating)
MSKRNGELCHTEHHPPIVAIDPFCDEFLEDPHAFHGVMRDVGPLFWLPQYNVYGMARYAEVSEALKDWETFCSSRGVGLSDFSRETPWRLPSLLLETDPPTHERTRKLMSSIVSPAAIKQIRGHWEQKAEELVESLVSKKRFDIVKDLAEVFPLMVFPDVIGLHTKGRENLLTYAAATFNAFGPRNARFEETNTNAAEAIAWVTEACRRESLAPGGWGMAVYDGAQRGECSEEEAERLVRSFLSAGVDTTVNGLSNMLHGFCLYPEQWKRLKTDPSLVKRAIEEGLRWDSTVQTFFRTTTRDVQVGGQMLPSGSKVILFLAAANRDPRRWPDHPERFDIGREAGSHVAFGFGIHRCLGQMVARLEAELILNALIKRTSSFRLIGPVKRRLNNTLRAVSSAPVEITAS